MSLASVVLDFDRAHPGDPDAEVIVPAETWTAWIKLAREKSLCIVPGCAAPMHCDLLCKRCHRRAAELGFNDVRSEQLRQLAEFVHAKGHRNG